MSYRAALSAAALLLAWPSARALCDAGQVQALEQATRTTPTNPQAWLQLGFAYRDVNNIDGAQMAFERALALQPGTREAVYMLGLIYEKRGRTQDALRMWRQYSAMENDPTRRAVAEKHIHQLTQ